ncbi:MAG: hypothetical protein A2Z02_06345 [Chloroflexi bacterium RBG_16_48_7]|nr:MAG: hypothetical protein A2Z02_06345 [Chloroflexi bacterium RBG_16_48_7]
MENAKRFGLKIMAAALGILALSGSLIACQPPNSLTGSQTTAIVKKGGITSSVEIRGKLEMPHEIKLRFATTGTIQKIYVTYGSQVSAGTLLAKLDDTYQKQAVKQAQYSVELAMNELVEKTYSTVMGYPDYYPSVGVVLRFEAAQKELARALELLNNDSYRSAMTELRLAIHDLEACRTLLEPPVGLSKDDYPNVFVSLDMLNANMDMLNQDTESRLSVQSLIDKGRYNEAAVKLATVNEKMIETHIYINGITGVIRSYFPLYPDTSTSLDISRQVKETLEQIQAMLKQGNGTVDATEKLRIALHDLEMSNDILEGSELIFNHGLNLKVLRANNLNLEKAETALDSAKTALMQTEILAPFDGIIVDVPSRENDILSQVNYATQTIVDLVDTSKVELDGYVDEKDVRNISEGQLATVYLDAASDRGISAKVAFVSPYGSSVTGPAGYFVQIAIDQTDIKLQRGLSASAIIPVGKRDNVLLVPAGAVRSSAGQYWVNVVKDAAGTIEKRTVTLGLQNSDSVEVTTGLNENETVVVLKLKQ